MGKKYGAYLTLEASFIFSTILMLYMAIIGISFSLFNECYSSQKQYILSFREARFNQKENENPVVIYGDMELGEYEDINGVRVVNPLNRIREER